jgi:hypothetical protein
MVIQVTGVVSNSLQSEGIAMAKLVDSKILTVPILIITLFACGPSSSLTYFHDPDMDFGSVRTVAVMPFENFTSTQMAAERVREIFANSLLATGAVYVVPSGEVARGINTAGITNPAAPSNEEIARLVGIVKVDALFTGTVTEYGTVRSGVASANVISFNVQMIEAQTRKVVWTASTTKGGISIWDRLLGSGGEPINDITMAAINDILNKLFE